MARKSSMRDKARERAKARKESQSFGSTVLKMPKGREVEFFKPTKGTMRIDVLPYVVTDPKHTDKISVGEEWHSRRYFMHRNVGADENSYVCPAKTWGERCPICDYAKMRREAGADKKELDSLRAKERQIFNVIDIKKDADKILLWDVSTFLFGEMLDEEIIEGDDEWAGFAELEDGYTLKVRFTEESFQKNTFYSAGRIDFEERDNYDESILDDVLPLDDLLVRLSYEDLEAIFHMEAPVSKNTDDEEDDDDDTPPPSRSKRNTTEKKVSRKRKDTDDEEEDEKPARGRKRAEPEDDDDEPSPRKSRSRTKSDDDDEDDAPPKRARKRAEPEPEDDDEEETPPKRTRKSRVQEDDDEDEAPAPKRGGRSRRSSEDDDEEDKPAPRRGRGRRNTEEDEDDD